MSFKIKSGAILGIKAKLVEVEAISGSGLPGFTIVGLPDKTVEESKERVLSAVKSLNLPKSNKPTKTIINLAPADLKKEGSLFDLPIALSYLLSRGAILFNPEDYLVAGELALDGRLRKIKGAILLAELAKEQKIKNLIIPKENLREASLISGVNILSFNSLREIISFLNKEKSFSFQKDNKGIFKLCRKEKFEIDFSHIGGQETAKRALKIAAVGNHNVLMLGPPGTGKTLLAKAFVSILPPLEKTEIIELTKIYSSAGLLDSEKELILQRPFRNPHHSASKSAIIGGGNPIRPGEITLAHRGVLFLDELPEFHRDVLESLRQPLEAGKILIARSKETVEMPAKFTLIGASNPCPCGNFSNPYKECSCSPSQILKYKRKLSGPLVDRIDIFLEIPYQDSSKIKVGEENSAKIRKEVIEALNFAKERGKGKEITLENFKDQLKIDNITKNILDKALDKGDLSLRGYFRVLKVARSIADLEMSYEIKDNHLYEALSYRAKND